MANPPIYNPNDYKVVEFHNGTDFEFTPEMGAMFDSRPIFGISGAPCIKPGESLTLPYHVGNLLAKNLAKAVMVRQAPMDDDNTINRGSLVKPLWSEERLIQLQKSFMKELYVEQRPIAETETDRLMRKVEELTKLVAEKMGGLPSAATEAVAPVAPATGPGQMAPAPTNDGPGQMAPAKAVVYKDKQEVITELEVRGIKHDKRKSKDDLEALLTSTAVPVPSGVVPAEPAAAA